MKRHIALLYFVAITIPLFLAAGAWQSVRYARLEREVRRMERAQEEWIENNKRLIAGMAVLSSAERIEHIARNELGLSKKKPEEIMQIRIMEGREIDG